MLNTYISSFTCILELPNTYISSFTCILELPNTYISSFTCILELPNTYISSFTCILELPRVQHFVFVCFTQISNDLFLGKYKTVLYLHRPVVTSIKSDVILRAIKLYFYLAMHFHTQFLSMKAIVSIVGTYTIYSLVYACCRYDELLDPSWIKFLSYYIVNKNKQLDHISDTGKPVLPARAAAYISTAHF